MSKAQPAPDYSAPIDVALEICPLNQRGQPDMLNKVPHRRVSVEEAKVRGWSMAWPGGGCRYAHDAAVWVSNPRKCSDCVRAKAGRQPIYPKIKLGGHYEQPRVPRKDQQPIVLHAPVVKQPEPDSSDKKFLAAYAALRDIDAASRAVGTTAANVVSRRSHNKLLDDAMTKLEANLTIPRLVPASSDYEWTDEKRARLIEVYVNSGNLAIARDAVKCTPSQLWREIDTDSTFAGQLEDARFRAAQVFEERAHAEALNGNDRLLPIVLKAERPDKYSERVRMDLSVNNSRMNEEQLANEIVRTLKTIVRIDPHFMAAVSGQIFDAEPKQLSAPPEVLTTEENPPDVGNTDNKDLG